MNLAHIAMNFDIYIYIYTSSNSSGTSYLYVCAVFELIRQFCFTVGNWETKLEGDSRFLIISFPHVPPPPPIPELCPPPTNTHRIYQVSGIIMIIGHTEHTIHGFLALLDCVSRAQGMGFLSVRPWRDFL